MNENSPRSPPVINMQRLCPATLRSSPWSSCGIWWSGCRRRVCSCERSRRPSSPRQPGRPTHQGWWRTAVRQSRPERGREESGSGSFHPAVFGSFTDCREVSASPIQVHRTIVTYVTCSTSRFTHVTQVTFKELRHFSLHCWCTLLHTNEKLVGSR